jgi:TIR domain
MSASQPQIFISYAQIDNQKIDGARIGWVDRLFETLDLELRQLGVDFNFWRDRRDLELDGFFDDKILSAVSASKVLIAVLSPVYPTRAYCVKELTHFVDKNLEEDLRERAKRVMKVVKQPLDDPAAANTLPTFLKDQLGFEFFSIDRQDNRLIRYIRSDGEIASPAEYWDLLHRLAQAIRRNLMALPRTTPDDSLRNTIYLAEPSRDMDAEYRTVRAELTAKGYRVLPENRLPDSEEDAITSIDKALTDAIISVHLLGARSGYIPDGPTRTPIVRLQLERAALAAKDRKLKRCIWIRKGLKASQEDQSALISSLARGTSLLQDDELVQEDLELFKTALLECLVSHKDRTVPNSPLTPEAVLLLCHIEDTNAARTVRKKLFEMGYEVFFQVLNENYNLTDIIKLYDGRVGSCLVFYGSSSELWVQQVLMELNLILKSTGRRSLKLHSVFIGGTPNERKSDFLSHYADLVVDATATCIDDALQEFANLLRR